MNNLMNYIDNNPVIGLLFLISLVLIFILISLQRKDKIIKRQEKKIEDLQKYVDDLTSSNYVMDFDFKYQKQMLTQIQKDLEMYKTMLKGKY